jgi:glucose uptake protein
MILPGSYTAALILLIAGMLGWGLWANFFKASAKQWRFELFYFDFAIGVFLAALIAALTFGSLGFDGFSFRDDLQLAGKRQDVFGLAAGAIFNLGNMLLLAGVSLTGMTLAFPAGLGCALVVSGVWTFFLAPGGSIGLKLAGMAAVIVAIVLDVFAFRTWADLRFKTQTSENNPGGKLRRRRSVGKGLALSLAGGLMLGSFGPLVQLGSASDIGLGPYAMGFVFSVGVIFSTFVFNLFFMNLPVQGKPVDIAEYFRGALQKHALGVFGGIVWYAGLIAILVRARFDATARVSTQASYAIEQSAMLIAALCGLLVWKEYDGSDSSVRLRLGLMFVLLAVGIGAMTAGVAVVR